MAKRIAWQEVELKYRAGDMSLKSIAAEFGISESSISRKAKSNAWQRKPAMAGTDRLRTVRIEKAALSDGAATIHGPDGSQKASVITMEQKGGAAQDEIILAQRRDIRRSRALVMALLQELEQQTGHIDILNDLSEVMAEPDEKGRDKRSELLQKLMSHASRTSTMKTLVDTLRLLVALEREAFGIDSKQKGGGSIEEWLEVVGDA